MTRKDHKTIFHWLMTYSCIFSVHFSVILLSTHSLWSTEKNNLIINDLGPTHIPYSLLLHNHESQWMVIQPPHNGWQIEYHRVKLVDGQNVYNINLSDNRGVFFLLTGQKRTFIMYNRRTCVYRWALAGSC